KEEHAPILILSHGGNYIEEILRAEGFNSFVSRSVDNLSGIDSFDVIILPAVQLIPSQSEIIKKYIRAGGNVIAFRPGKNLSSIFNLRLLKDTITDPYISIDGEKE